CDNLSTFQSLLISQFMSKLRSLERRSLSTLFTLRHKTNIEKAFIKLPNLRECCGVCFEVARLCYVIY
ncbi:hypothetical protein PMAYCL1PPCAC_17366, partial [Pristionchus mayeri]